MVYIEYIYISVAILAQGFLLTQHVRSVERCRTGSIATNWQQVVHSQQPPAGPPGQKTKKRFWLAKAPRLLTSYSP
jgi:hypothetical protein